MTYVSRLSVRITLWVSFSLLLSPALAQWDRGTSRDGRVQAVTTGRGVFVRRSPHAPLTPLFLHSRPGPLLTQLQAAKSGPLKDLANGFDPDLAKDPRQWADGDPLVTPDGRSVLFVTNLGQSMGAQGNTFFVLVRAEAATGRLTLLRGAGEFFGRVPDVFTLSPDGRSLLISLSAHDSADSAPWSVTAVDLTTQHATDLLGHDPEARRLSNWVDAVRWSPNGRQVAVRIAWYDPDTLADYDALPRTTHWEIKDARTGITLRRLPRSVSPWRR